MSAYNIGRIEAYVMSSLQEKILADVEQLDTMERLEVIASIVAGLQQKPELSPKNKLSRQNLFGCLRGQVTIAEDFNAPLSDFAEYM
jgi:Protein of unknown function (DUF2281)